MQKTVLILKLAPEPGPCCLLPATAATFHRVRSAREAIPAAPAVVT